MKSADSSYTKIKEERFSSLPSWGPIPTPPSGFTWKSLMTLALNLAKQAENVNEVPVGAVIIHQNGKVVSTAHNETISAQDPTAHAEIIAIRRACLALNNYRLTNCTLIVTLEPCLMCVGAISEAHLSGIVYGATDNRSGAVSSVIEGFSCCPTNPTPWYYGGVESQKCSDILINFFKTKR